MEWIIITEAVMPKNLWILESSGHDGDYCDVDSRFEYRSGNITDAVEAEAEAIAEGTEVWWGSAPIDGSTYDVLPGQQFTIAQFEEDGQGVQFQRREGK